jgi:hypothetical protein
VGLPARKRASAAGKGINERGWGPARE